MLVLSRRQNQSIIIDNDRITIEVLSVKAGQVRIGITADKDIKIRRGELKPLDQTTQEKLT